MRSFEKADAEVVANWPTSESEIRLWCSRDDISADVITAWADAETAYCLEEDGELIAYGEIWIDPDEEEVELAHLIVRPSSRGRGVGRRLIAELVAEGLQHYPAIFLRVHPDNATALRSYLGAGFVEVPTAEADEWNRDQPTPYRWLRYR